MRIVVALLMGMALAGCISTDDVGSVPAADATRFIAWGDTGTGKEGQQLVANAAWHVCEDRGCDFVLQAGDNIYEDGPTSVDDPQFDEKFEQPYARFDVPFYLVLGNHDNGDGYGTDSRVGDIEVAYHYREDKASDKWYMPARYYMVNHGHVTILALDSNTAVLAGDPLYQRDLQSEAQQAWIDESRQAIAADHPDTFTVALAHHPYISNGQHGDAGNFDGVPGFGLEWKRIYEQSVCGVDVFVAGHDHDLQWLDSAACPETSLIVSGAAAKTRPLGSNSHPSFFERGSGLGFFWVEVTDTTWRAVAYDVSGEVLFEREELR